MLERVMGINLKKITLTERKLSIEHCFNRESILNGTPISPSIIGSSACAQVPVVAPELVSSGIEKAPIPISRTGCLLESEPIMKRKKPSVKVPMRSSKQCMMLQSQLSSWCLRQYNTQSTQTETTDFLAKNMSDSDYLCGKFSEISEGKLTLIKEQLRYVDSSVRDTLAKMKMSILESTVNVLLPAKNFDISSSVSPSAQSAATKPTDGPKD
ncbi:hypothetical protein NDU88_002439 [Pleurodeles waltl]|uniref:Uncharacterized protein n=1 Tax=Pleurodeles waltl TaxID=8319 RepID=A0AAV7W3B4_PLEWA|nr:hypothetical protein NDU88_002439 [Pleurodeles waltl]